MSQFVVRGIVQRFGDQAWNIAVSNGEELRRFWTDEQIDTRLDWAGDGPPLVTVGAQPFVDRCQAGDEVEYTIETKDRSSGRGIEGVDLQVIARGPTI